MTVSEPTDERSLLHATEHLVSSLATLGYNALVIPRVAAQSECVSRELRHARAVGQFTVLMAVARIKSTLFDSVATPDTSVPDEPPADVPDPPSCIPDYLNLSAAQIVPLLKALTQEEREDVIAFENSTRRRRTILSALGVRSS